VRDFEPLGRVQDDGQILKVCLDSGHGEDSVDRMVRQEGSAEKHYDLRYRSTESRSESPGPPSDFTNP
jgi:hypothetical protein